jgi:hypothetical protein
MRTKLSLFLLILALSKAFAKATAFKATALCSVLCALSFVPCALSQIPQGFNYQAVARNGAGEPIGNTAMPVMITIQGDSLGTDIIWKELHSSVTTTAQGAINIVLGRGAKQAGSASTFSAIDWSITPRFIKTEINYNGWKAMGVTRLWSVPYAMMAGGTGAPFKKLSVNGETAINDEALFEVKNKDGNTVFAVYNEGVRVYVSDGEKGIKGGFAVGGFGTDKAESQKYLVVSKDSVRIYLDTNPATKKLKGGFAVGGYDMTKGTSVEDYLQVTRDSTRIYVKENAGKKLKGGFAVGGFDVTKGTQNITPFTSLTSDNYLIGHRAGSSITSGRYNSFLGYEAGFSNTSGHSNILLGFRSGHSNTGGSYNIFLGDSAGVSNTTGEVNVFMGFKAGFSNTTGNYNILIGDSAGAANTTGLANVFVGNWAGYMNTTGQRNVILGVAGYETTTGQGNVFLGTFAGTKNHEGNRNVYIGDYAGAYTSGGDENVFVGKSAGALSLKGYRNVFLGAWAGNQVDSAKYCVFLGPSAGWSSKRGERNVFIGPFSGYSNEGTDNVFLGNEAGYYETSSNKLYISNSATTSPLLYGEFNMGMLVVNGNRWNNLAERTFFVNGSAGGLYPWYNDSDMRLKHDIATIPDALQKVLKLRGVNFLWNNPAMGMEGLQMGFIGQEAFEVVPEIVSVNSDHYSMQYAPVTALLVEAVKEQQSIIEKQQVEIERLKSLENEISELKAIVSGLRK